MSVWLSRYWHLYYDKIERPLDWKPREIGFSCFVIKCYKGLETNFLDSPNLMLSESSSSWIKLLGFKSQLSIAAIWPKGKFLPSLCLWVIIWVLIPIIIIIYTIEYLSHKVFMQVNLVNPWTSLRIDNSDWPILSTQ